VAKEEMGPADNWPPRILTSTKMPIQFYVDDVVNPDYDISLEVRQENPWSVMEGDQAVGRLLYSAGGVNKRGPYLVDVTWPQKYRVQPDMSSIDEGACDLIHGLVRAIRPRLVLETGTHKGRSTHAITSALCKNEYGVMYTLDCIKWIDLTDVLSPGERERITQIVGVSPHALAAHPLGDLKGIDFAFLDGAHDGETLLREIEYVDAHRSSTCYVAIDNSLDAGWPEIRKTLDEYDKYPWHAVIETMAGMDLICMRDEPPKVAEGATHQVAATPKKKVAPEGGQGDA